MRTIALLLFLMLISGTARSSIYDYPSNRRPSLSLREACDVAQAMLRARGEHKRFYITEVSLLGDKAGSGWGAWNLWHHDSRGNQVNAYIPFPTGRCSLNYHPKKGADKEVEFIRKETTVVPVR